LRCDGSSIPANQKEGGSIPTNQKERSSNGGEQDFLPEGGGIIAQDKRSAVLGCGRMRFQALLGRSEGAKELPGILLNYRKGDSWLSGRILVGGAMVTGC
jgi:hypothetical protein